MKYLISLLLLITSTHSYSQSIYVYSTKGEPIEYVKATFQYQLYDSLQTDLISNKLGLLKIPTDSNGGIYFLHPVYNPVYLDVSELKEKDTVRMEPFQWRRRVSIKHKRNDEGALEGRTITTIKAKTIEQENAGTAADLLNSSGEVFVQKSQLGGGSPMIRGFSANRVLIVVDDIRINNAIYRSGNLQNVLSVDPNYLESASVIFGPGSLTYGSDALGGVMDFSTKGGRFSKSKDFQVKGSTLTRFSSAANEKHGHLDFNVYNYKLSLTTSFSYSSFDDLKMGEKKSDEFLRASYIERKNGIDVEIPNSNPHKQIGSGFDNYQLLQKVSYKSSENLTLNYGFYYSSTSDIPRYDRLIVESNGKLQHAEWHYGPQTWQMNRIGINYKEDNPYFDQIDAVLAFQTYKESRIDRKVNELQRSIAEEQVDLTTFNLDFEKEIKKKQHIYYGLEMNSNLISSTANSEHIENGTSNRILTRYPDNSTWNSEAIYVMMRKDKDSSSLFGGIRLNAVQIEGILDTTIFPFPTTEINNSLVNANASIGHQRKIKNHWEISSNLSSGFRAPNMDDIAKVFDSEPGNVLLPNPKLKPEIVYSGDFSLKHYVKKKSKFLLSIFASYLNHAMVRQQTTFNGQDSILYKGIMSAVSQLGNAESATIYGFSIAYEKALNKNLNIGGTITVTEGSTSEGQPLRHVSPTFGKAYLNWKSKRLFAEINTHLNGKMDFEDLAPSEINKAYIYSQDENGNPFSKNWYTLNALLSYKAGSNITVNAGVDNILDLAYRPYSSGIAAPGRNFVVSLRYHLK